MNHKRVSEETINASLDAYLHGATEGDTHQAQHLHEMLGSMLTGKETPEGQLWLTEHGKMLLADMHRQLSHCDCDDERLLSAVLDAVQLKPHQGKWKDTSSFVRDLRIAVTVANELCEQRDSGLLPDPKWAADRIAEGGDFSLDSSRILEIYEEIASTVGGFREISRC
jgi:hypothetical protein